MAEIPDVVGGNTVESQWGNQIRDRSLQRYLDAAARDLSVTLPVAGDMAYLTTTDEMTIFDGAAWVTNFTNLGGVIFGSTEIHAPNNQLVLFDNAAVSGDDRTLFVMTNGVLTLHAADIATSQRVISLQRDLIEAFGSIAMQPGTDIKFPDLGDAIGIQRNQGMTLELGSTVGGVGTITPFMDFHTGDAVNDHDARIIVTGGVAGVQAKGTMEISAGTVRVTSSDGAVLLGLSSYTQAYDLNPPGGGDQFFFQHRNITMSDVAPAVGQGIDGDVWIQYTFS